MSFNKIILISIVLTAISCKHDPYPYDGPPGLGNDTITNPPPPPPPVDTTIACDPDTVYFQNQILPLLSANCATSGCHDAQSHQEGVILDSYFNIRNTADVRPGNPSGSDLYEVLIETDPDKRMPPPPASPLTTEQIQLVYKWIQQGAKNNRCDECDTTNVTFSGSVEPILSNYCYSCHSGANPVGGSTLTTYQDVVNAVNNSDLYERVQRMQGFSPMPPGGTLPACDLNKIGRWISDGMPNN